MDVLEQAVLRCNCHIVTRRLRRLSYSNAARRRERLYLDRAFSTDSVGLNTAHNARRGHLDLRSFPLGTA